ncbi:MAG: zinc-binding dehydrogenase [bacterium]|nr:zinc-binding dehydrogenase [bacterium]
MKKGNPYGTHRVIEPLGVLPQPAVRISNDMEIFDNEIRVNVEFLNVDSASFTQIKEQAGGDVEKIKSIILDIVSNCGKLKNPVTGSGGIFIGRIDKIGDKIKDTVKVKEGDKISSLVSLSLTPLRIDEIIEVKKDIDQVVIKGQAILFESGIYVKLPEDMAPSLAMAVLDVAGAPAQTERLVKKDDTVAVIGAAGKSGILCAYVAKKIVGADGKVIGIGHSDKNVELLSKLGVCDEVVKIDATDAVACYEKIIKITDGKLCDVVINNVNIQNTEMGSILMTRDRGKVYFFSMATSFTKAALGAEGVGKDIDMIIGNGYAHNHAETALNIVRESQIIRKLYEKLYV